MLRLLNRMGRSCGYTIQKVPELSDLALEPHIEQIIEKVWSDDLRRTKTMTSPERLNALINAVEYIVDNNIRGAMVECGVWRGGSMIAIAETLARQNIKDRDLYLFDTFEGMPPPSSADCDYQGSSANKLMNQSRKSDGVVWACSQLDEVKKNFDAVEYPSSQIHYIEGRVEETVPDRAPNEISLLRIDTDWYESTKHELVHLFPRLSVGGVLIIDDYGHWKGARKAVDEFFESMNFRPLLQRIDYTGRLVIKTTP